MITDLGYAYGKMSVNRAWTMIGRASLEIWVAIDCGYWKIQNRLVLLAKEWDTHTLPHFELERQQKDNDFWSCLSGNSQAICWFLNIIKVLAAFIGRKARDTLSAPAWEWGSMECWQVITVHPGWSKCDALVIVYIRCYNSISRLQQSLTLSCIIVKEISCYWLGGCRGNVACLSA